MWDLYQRNITGPIYPSGDDDLLFDHTADSVLLRPLEAAIELRQQAELYPRERELICGALIIVGSLPVASGEEIKTRRICAPIVLVPAEIDTECMVSLELEGRRLNYPLLDAISKAGDEPELVSEIEAVLPARGLDAGAATVIAGLLSNALPEIESYPGEDFPKLVSEAEIKATRKTLGRQPGDSEASLMVMPAVAVALVPRNFSTRGLLSELELLAQNPAHRALGQLLGEPMAGKTDASNKLSGHVPTRLSPSQERILKSARKAPVTLAVGPPGTGKSFTLAAIALEHMCMGESVIVASRNHQAVDVIGDKVDQIIGDLLAVVRGGRKEHQRRLISFVEDLLQGYYLGDDRISDEFMRQAEAAITTLDAKVDPLEKALRSNIRDELEWGELRAHRKRGLWKTWQFRRLTTKRKSARPLWRYIDRLDVLHADRTRAVIRYLRLRRRWNLQRAHELQRSNLQSFVSMLKAQSSRTQFDREDSIDWEWLIHNFPIWLTTFDDVHRILPQRNQLFDVAIIDEASQCDLASALPVIQRARRVVIAGDPKQLRHLSFIPNRRVEALAQIHGLDTTDLETLHYRRQSLLDAALKAVPSGSAMALLDEHFRSLPALIDFNNREFYRGQLKVMTDIHSKRDVLTTAPELGPLRLRAMTSAVRHSDGSNPSEVQAVVGIIKTIINSRSRHSSSPPRTIGVLSPFRGQVDAIVQALRTELPPLTFQTLIEEHAFLAGTAHTFQGEERDHMVLSFAISSTCGSGTRRFLEQPDVFNVSTSRARIRQTVIASVKPSELPHDSLFRRYLLYATGESSAESRQNAERIESGDADQRFRLHEKGAGAETDPFAEEIAATLEDWGYEVEIGTSVIGSPIDLVIRHGENQLGVDLVGYPGPFAPALTIGRYQLLERAGLPMFALPHSRWMLDRTATLRALLEAIPGPKPNGIPEDGSD